MIKNTLILDNCLYIEYNCLIQILFECRQKAQAGLTAAENAVIEFCLFLNGTPGALIKQSHQRGKARKDEPRYKKLRLLRPQNRQISPVVSLLLSSG